MSKRKNQFVTNLSTIYPKKAGEKVKIKFTIHAENIITLSYIATADGWKSYSYRGLEEHSNEKSIKFLSACQDYLKGENNPYIKNRLDDSFVIAF